MSLQANLTQFIQYSPVPGAASYELESATTSNVQITLLTGLSEPKASISVLFPTQGVGFNGRVRARSIDAQGGEGPWSTYETVGLVGLPAPSDPTVVDA